MKHTLLLSIAITCLNLPAQAVTFIVNVDDGSLSGGTGGNPANSGSFVARNPGDTDSSTGIYNEVLTDTAENNPTYTVTYLARFEDDTLGLGLTGLEIQYEIVASGFFFNGTNTVTANIDEASGHLGIRGGSNNGTIDSAGSFGGATDFEFLRLSIGNVSVTADPNNVLTAGQSVVVDGFVGHTVRVGSTSGTETGSVYIAGTTDAGTTALDSYDGTSFRHYLTWGTPALAVDTYPDTGPVGGQGVDAQGFKAQFSIIPEPSTLSLLGLAALGLLRRRRK